MKLRFSRIKLRFKKKQTPIFVKNKLRLSVNTDVPLGLPYFRASVEHCIPTKKFEGKGCYIKYTADL